MGGRDVQAVILAGGKNERFGGESKALAEIGGQTMIERIIATLPPEIQNLVIVTDAKSHHRISFILRNSKICEFVVQAAPKGTAIALLSAAPYIRDDFILMGADTLFQRIDVANVAQSKPPALAVRRVGKEKKPGAIFKDGSIFEEPPLWQPGDCESVMLYKLSPLVLDRLHGTGISPRGEYEIQAAINFHLSKAGEPNLIAIGPYHHMTTQEDHERIQQLFSDIG